METGCEQQQLQPPTWGYMGGRSQAWPGEDQEAQSMLRLQQSVIWASQLQYSPEPGHKWNSKMDTAAAVHGNIVCILSAHLHVAMLAGNTASHPGAVPHPHLPLLGCWECGHNGLRLPTSFWNGSWCWNPCPLIIRANRGGSSLPSHFLPQPPCPSACHSALLLPSEQHWDKWKHFYLSNRGKSFFKSLLALWKCFQTVTKATK